jgi:hypothetical protein
MQNDKGALRQVFICLISPPPYTLYTCKLYTYSHREGGRGGEWKGEWGNTSQRWVENTNLTDCISAVYKL